MSEINNNQEPKRAGPHPNKASLQAYIQDFSKEAIDGIVWIMRFSRNEQLKFAAQKLIIDKTIADVKAVEVSGKDGGPIKLNLIMGAGFDYISGPLPSHAASTGSDAAGPAQIQGSRLAPEGPKDNNSDNRDNQAST